MAATAAGGGGGRWRLRQRRLCWPPSPLAHPADRRRAERRAGSGQPPRRPVCRRAAVSFPGTRLPRAVVTGNPVRPRSWPWTALRPGGRRRGPPWVCPTAGAWWPPPAAPWAPGGSTTPSSGWPGSGLIVPDVAIRHVTGERDFEAMRAAAPVSDPGGLVYQQVPFEDRMDLLLAAADVMSGGPAPARSPS